uniref:C-type lectin domain-containing protein n=1 Tax=Anopheles epiroticus TaxID=199890 RepID=A0A182P645_9DIPT
MEVIKVIGGTDLGRVGRWVWIHSNKPIPNGGYTNFYPGMPDNGGGFKDCLIVDQADRYNRGKRDDQNCLFRVEGYICAFAKCA